MSEPVRIGLLGRGTVGGAFAELVEQRADAVEEATGRRPQIGGVLTRSDGDAEQVIEGSDLVVELMGGTDPARDYVLEALRGRKPVVAAKMAILARLAFHTPVSLAEVDYEGIETVQPDDLAYAKEFGLSLKLLGVAERRDGGISVRVFPCFLYRGHPLAPIEGAFNAVMVEAPAISEVTMSGPGAGGGEAASAVLGDACAGASAGSGAQKKSTCEAASAMPAAMIERYRDRLSLKTGDPVATLTEGSTPLIEAPRLSERTGARAWLKFEGTNPTGSFKDRGMTVAVSRAKGGGAEAVICASTGNTAASAAAYAARAGMRGAVIVPEG